MTKLLLRKPNAWHRLDSLKYEAELGSKEGLIQAIDEICFVPGQVKVNTIDEEAAKMSVEEREIIDLTDDVYPPPSLPSHILQPREIPASHSHQPESPISCTIKTEEVSIPVDTTVSAANAITGPSSIKVEDLPMADTTFMSYGEELLEPAGILAEDESQMDLPVLLECLKVDELRGIAKQMRVKANSKVCPHSPRRI
jgi:Fanconi-associated nuclease 1